MQLNDLVPYSDNQAIPHEQKAVVLVTDFKCDIAFKQQFNTTNKYM